MEAIAKVSLFIHILAGAITLIAGPVAIWGRNNTRLHRTAGKLFFGAMVIVVITAIAGFLQHPHSLFYQFLLGISMLVGFHIAWGVRAIYIMKGRVRHGRFEAGLVGLLLSTGVLMVGLGVWHYFQGTPLPMVILLCVFGAITFPHVIRCRRILRASDIDPRWWLLLHVNSMFGAFIASTTAFAVNAMAIAPWYIQWFGPTLIFVPIQIYILRQRGLSKHQLPAFS